MTDGDKHELKKQFMESYEERKARLQSSDAHKRWKGLTSSQRMYIAGIVVFVVIALVMLVANYWDVAQVPSPSGEGG